MSSSFHISDHGTLLEGQKGKVRCFYCDKVMSSGFYRLRFHLACIRGDVAPCENVPTDVKLACQNEIHQKKTKSAMKVDEKLHTSEKRKRVPAGTTRASTSSRSTLPQNSGMGCSIVLEAWLDPNSNKTLMEALANHPKGKAVHLKTFDISGLDGKFNEMMKIFDQVLEQVGVNNVVQIISYSTSPFMKELGKRVMAKYTSLYWTVSASYCFKKMLNRIFDIDWFKDTLDMGKKLADFYYSDAVIHDLWRDHGSITQYFTLEKLVIEEETVITFFTSRDWKGSAKGKWLADLVADSSFWNRMKIFLNAGMPIVQALESINEENKAKISLIYDKLDQVKEEIKSNLKRKESRYLPIWEAIDEIWNTEFHSPLHSAAYFLNPCLFYSTSFFCDDEVISGLFECVTQMVDNKRDVHLIIKQLDDYKMIKGTFLEGSLEENRDSLAPETWWLTYGSHCPELQRFAIRILSQTCNGSSE